MTRALIVIDVQKEYFPGGKAPLFEAEETEARILDAIARARAVGDKVILIRHEFPADQPIFAAGTPGTQIRDAILAAAGDAPVITKNFADAFQDTDLSAHLDGVESLLICGMMTQNCVAFTAMSDLAAGYKVTVLGDLCAAPSQLVHGVALNALASKRPMAEAQTIWP